jgi:glycosyltransferase involved in cell wall biosynthesis
MAELGGQTCSTDGAPRKTVDRTQIGSSMTNVSIIVPFLNAERFLAEAIASVRSQSYQDWELLLIDDGSTDESCAIASAAAVSDVRIRLLARPPEVAGGAAAARNAGLREASGDLIAFLDADDLYEPHRLESQVGAFELHPEIMAVYGPTRWWHPGAEDRDWIEPMQSMAQRVHPPPKLLTRVLLLQRGHVPCTCSVTVKREAMDQVGGFEEFELYEDQTLLVKVFARYPVYITGVVSARYRQHDYSVSARATRSGEYSRLRPHSARTEFLGWVQDYVRDMGLNDASVERALSLAKASNEGDWRSLSFGERLTLVRFRFADQLERLRWRLLSVVRSSPRP